MNKKLLFILPVAMLLASCGGSKPTGNGLIYGKTFVYAGAFIDKSESNLNWVESHFDDIPFDTGETGARVTYINAKGQEKYDEIEGDDPEEVWENIDRRIDDIVKNEMTMFSKGDGASFEFGEYDSKGTKGKMSLIAEEKIETEIAVSDIEGKKHGEAVNFSGTFIISDYACPVEGTFVASNINKGEIVYTDLDFKVKEEGDEEIKCSNVIQLIFPLKSSDESLTIQARANFLPKAA